MTLLTVDQLRAMIPSNKEVEEWCEELNKALPKYGITTDQRIAGFVSQCAHESMDFTAMSENLNYREETLNKVFPRYFGPGKRNAAEYARNPEKIANYVYMDEFRTSKLGNTQPGDGWRFRGRGLKQLTGRDNYTRFAKDYGMTAEEAAVWVETKEGALASALWFWNTNKLNDIADTGNVAALTKKINGGDIGLADRQARYAKAMAALGGKIEASAPVNSQITDAVTQTLRKGSKGDLVKKLQAALNIGADGDFGQGTENALKKWQDRNGLTADGVAGPKTLAKLLG
ncbi:COG3179 Predicted chitinase [uncultured Caudovirales phage]|uniref:COG3179 Predicted chitinase n=1 Tax=uncultured Caudovirales phage TaxID=2100421 RepID=A0A6J7X203_9CAUD|nr:COG3179 Predicted chitinase [uncultured Caudovirales phage]